MIALPRSARRTSYTVATSRVLRLTAVIWSLAWLATLVAAYIPDTSFVSNPMWVSGSLVILGISWALLAFVPRIPPMQFVACVSATAVVITLSVDLGELAAHAIFVTTILNLGAITAALVLTHRRAVPVIVFLAVLPIFTIGVRSLFTPENELVWQTTLMAAAYCLAVGMAVRVCSTVVRSSAKTADDEAIRAESLAKRVAEQRGHFEEAERVTRLLHDTCINTLGAIRDGIGRQDPESVRARCAHDLALLIGDVDAPATITDLVHAVRDVARVLNVDLCVSLELDDQPFGQSGVDSPPSPAILIAARDAIREALTNISKHARASKASLTIRSRLDTLEVSIDDDGPGWSGRYEAEGGIEKSIRQRVVETGGDFLLRTSGDAGTSIVMTWSNVGQTCNQPEAPDDFDVSSGSSAAVRRGLRSVVLGAGIWLAAYAVAATAIFFDTTVSAGSLVALGIIAISLVWTAKWSTSVWPWWLDGLLLIGIALVVALPGRDGTCLTTTPSAWGPDGAAVLALIACMLGTRWWSPLLAICGFAIGLFVPIVSLSSGQASCVETTVTVMAIEVGVVIVIYFFRRLLVRTWSSADGFRRQERQLQAGLADAAARDRVRTVRLSWLVGSIGDFMRQLARGELDPRSSSVVTTAGTMETTLRSLLALDPRLGSLGDLLAEEVVHAIDVGSTIEVRTSEPVVMPTPEQLSAVQELFRILRQAAGPGSHISVSVFNRDAGGLLLIVAPPNVATALAGWASSSLVRVDVEELDAETLLTVAW